jgi:XFP-like protein
MNDPDHDVVSRYRRCAAHQRVDHHARKRAATTINLERAEMEDWHHLTSDTYEEGKLTLEEYLGRVVFYDKRPFSRAQFRRLIFAQSNPYPEMIELVAQLKVRHGLTITVVSNEGREVNAYQIRKFKRDGFVDSSISSCFVHVRGYKEEGTIPTPLDMTVLNDLDRFHLVMGTIDRLPQTGDKGIYLKQQLKDKLIKHKQYIDKNGQDTPENRDWTWSIPS